MYDDLQSTLAQSILKQVEYYFSRENLRNDHYLVSKMNPQMFVPLDVVAGFKMLRNLTNDVELIRQVVKSSSKLQVDETNGCMIRPVFAAASRTTLILRGMPSSVKEEEIRSLFPDQTLINSVKPDIGETWFVTFTTESACLTAFEACQDKEFQGEPIKARIKSENLLKNFLPAPSPPPETSPPVFPPVNFAPFPVGHPMHAPYPFFMPGMRVPFGMNPMMMPPPTDMYNPPKQQQQPIPVAQQQQQQQTSFNEGGRGRGNNRGSARAPYFNRGRIPGRSQSGGTSNQKPQGPKRNSHGSNNKPQNTPKLGPSDFPPLPSNSQPVGGYERSFIKYSKQDIIEVLCKLQTLDIELPAEIPLDCCAVCKQMNRDIELIRPTEEVVEENIYSKKSFAEAVITAKDIKPPEKLGRRNSSKKGQSPYTQQNRGSQGSKRGSRNSRNKRPEETKKNTSADENIVAAPQPTEEPTVK